MVIKVQTFNSGGKAQGPGLLMAEDEFRFAMTQPEANGGFTINVMQEDEFGNETRMTIHFDKTDIEQMKPFIA